MHRDFGARRRGRGGVTRATAAAGGQGKACQESQSPAWKHEFGSQGAATRSHAALLRVKETTYF
ncbi:hypothetical protein APV28_1480 [Comamonas testosteroni]|nr:hypothetical protein APV28_1480 [Comamonas testosteroni]